jgi:hypothetical protein
MQHVMRSSLKPFGKAREKCISMLEEIGITVRSCSPALGHWRSAPYADVYRWEFTGEYKGITICGGCWETMTECAKAGKLRLDEKESEVWAVKGASNV